MKPLSIRLGSITDLRNARHWDAETIRKETRNRAALLCRLGVTPGDIVGIFHGNSLEFFADLLAVWQVGATAACLNEKLTATELENVANFLSVKLLLVNSEDFTAADLHVPVVCASSRTDGQSELPADIALPISLDQPALILFTSGTTSTPKGVVHTYRSLLARTALNRQIIGDIALQRTLCLLPTHFGHGLIGNCLTPLFAGCELFIYPYIQPHEYGMLANILHDGRITFMSSVPAMWKLALKLSRANRELYLQRIHIGSAPLSSNLWREIVQWSGIEDVVNAYGITETANWTAGVSAAELPPEDGLVGRMWGGHAAVLNGDGELQNVGEGEIVLQTPSLMMGYYKMPDLTGEVLTSGWYQTGDSGSIDTAGTIRLVGRRKSEINRAGTKVQPEEIDMLLERHPLVAEACAFGIPDEVSGEIVGVALVMTQPGHNDSKSFREWCRKRIKPDNVPEKWYFLAEIPKTDRGKINRESVLQACLEAEGTA